VLKPELSTDTEVIGRFFNEAKAANQIGHPGIVDVFDLGEMSNGHCYMVMELLEGESLDQYRSRRGPISEGEARMIGLRVLDILGAAHAKGIIHRDLKPANIFLSRKAGKSTLKLLDFGIAKLMGNKAPMGATQSGTFLGTPRYMAPEQARSASGIDARADLYSLGVVLYELLTGKPIFPVDSAVAMIHAHQFEEAALIRSIRPEISTALERVLARALVKDPKDRYSSAEEFSQALRVAYQPGAVDDQGDGPSTIVDDRPFGADARSTVEMDLEFPLDAGGIELEAAPSIREAATQIQAAPVSSRLAALAPAPVPAPAPAPEKAKKKKSAFADPERDTQEDPPGSQGDIGTIEIGAAPPIRKAAGGAGWVWAVLLALLGAGALLLVLRSGALQRLLE
jgi:serine/threonine-protein kinase